MSKLNQGLLFGGMGLVLVLAGIVATETGKSGTPAYLLISMIFMFLTARCLDRDHAEKQAAKKQDEQRD